MGTKALTRAALIGSLLCGLLSAQTSPTTTSLTTSAGGSSSQLGQPVTLTATVVVTATGGAVETGSVTFFSGTNFLGIGALNDNGNGEATLRTSLLPVGTNSLTAFYQGSGPLGTSRSSAVSLVVYSLPQSGFGAANTSLSAGAGAYDLAVGDFNGDGIADLVVANYQGGTVGVYIGNGLGGFTRVGPFTVGSYPIAVVVGDFNGDGKMDIATANSGADVSIFLNTSPNGATAANVTFAAAVPYSTGIGTSALGMAMGDFNGDGIADLAVASENDTVIVLLGSSANPGTFGPPASFTVGYFPYALAVGDFNGDGKADIVVTNGNSGDGGSDGVNVLLGNGAGSFSAAPGSPFSVGGQGNDDSPYFIAVGDFNGDGNLDVATANAGSNNVSILLGTGTGALTLTAGSPYAVGTNPRGIVVGDFNGDGKLDLATANFGGTTISVLLGTGTGVFSAATSYPLSAFSPQSLVVGDFNGDGISDVATANYESNTLSILLGLPATFTAMIAEPNPAASGSSVQLTAEVAPASVGDTVTFFNQTTNTNLGTSSITAVNDNVGTATLSTSALPVGTNQLYATYSGGATYGPSTSATYSEVINAASATTTTLSLSSGTNPSDFGQSLTFRASVSSSGTATGTVAFYDGVNLLSGGGAVALNSGVATYTTAVLSVGAHSLKAVYSGDSNNLGSTSSTLSVTINPALTVTTTTLPAAVQGTAYSAAVVTSGGTGTVAWSVLSGTLPQGLIFNSGGTFFSTPTQNGTFTFTLKATDAGGGSAQQTYTLLVNFSGTVITTGLPAGMAIINVSGCQDQGGICTTASTWGGNGAQHGPNGGANNEWDQPYNTLGPLLEYTVQPGTYTFRVIDPTDASATFPSIFPSAAAAQNAGIQTSWTYNSPWLTSVLVFDSSAASNSSQTQLFSVAEGDPGPTAGSTITTSQAQAVASCATIPANTGLSQAQAQALAYCWATTGNGGLVTPYYNQIFPLTRAAAPQSTITFPQVGVFPPIGAGPETLVFAVADNGLQDNGGGISVLIAPVAPALSLTTLYLPSGTESSSYSPVTLAASGGSGIYTWSASGLPAGLTVSSAGILSGTPTVYGTFSPVTLTVTDPVSGLFVSGSYSIMVSPAANLISTTTSLSLTAGTNPSIVSQSVTFTATVSPTPTGTGSEVVQLFVDGSSAATATGNAGTAIFAIPISSLSAGSHSITAVYAGDTADVASTSAVLTQVVEGGTATTTTIVPPEAPIFGQSATLQASVSAQPSSPTSGTVTFYDGAVVLGTASLYENGSASLSTVLLSEGKREIRARYDGTAVFAPSLSAVANPQVVVQTNPQVGFSAESLASDPNLTPIAGGQGIVVGSFATGGSEDVAFPVATAGSVGVEVQYGTSDGTFQTVNFFPTLNSAGTPVAIAAADLNGDGAEDLVVVTSTKIEVLLNTNSVGGNGIFSTAVPYSPGATSSLDSIAIADFNGDGISDLVVGGSGSASVLLGNGDGTFRAAVAVNANPVGSVYVAAADFNNDGMADLALADATGDVDVLLGNGNGTFQAQRSFLGLNGQPSIAVGDVNNDGNPDIVVGGSGAVIKVLFGDGSGGFGLFATPTITSGAAALVTTGDFNGDGISDIAVADNHNGGIKVLLSNGDGTFQAPASYPTRTVPNAFAVGNFEADGYADLALADGLEAGVMLGSPDFFNFVSVVDGTSPLAYFRLESLSGTSEVSDDEYNYSATGSALAPGAPIAVPGNQAALLDGNTGAVTTDMYGRITTAASMMAWVKLAALPSTLGRIEYVAGESQVGNDFDLQFLTAAGTGANVLGFFTTNNGQFLSYTPAAGSLIGNWHFIVATFDAEAATRAIYWDGALVASDTTVSLTDKNGNFEIGASSVFTGRDFEGSIDEVAVWNYALTPFQVSQLYYMTRQVLPNGVTNQSYGPLTLTATGGSGEYSWSATGLPSGLSLNSGSFSPISGTPTVSGVFPVTLGVTDLATNRSSSMTYSLAIGPLGSTISLTSSPNPATPGQPVTLTANVSPAYTPATAAPTGNVQFLDGTNPLGTVPLNSSGVATLSVNFASGQHSLTAHYAGDTNFQASVSPAVNQSVAVPYTPLSITTSSLPSGIVGRSYSAGLTASGGSGNYLWSASGLPSGLGLSASGALSGTPSAPFNNSVYFTVSDLTAGSSTSEYLTLSITAPAIVISGNGNLGDVAVGSSVAASFSVAGGIAPYTWSLSGVPGLSVDANGNVRGSAAQAGNFAGAVTVTDSVHSTSSASLSLSVLGLTGSFPAGTTTSAYSGSASGVGGAAPYSYTASGVPAGLSFSGGTLSGQERTPGSYTIGVVVTDHDGVSVSGNFSFTITGPAPVTLSVTTTSLPNGTVGQPYSETLGAAGGAPGYTWSQSGGQMPAGLSLGSGGSISGTPTSAGSYTIGVEVTDTSGAQVLTTAGLTIQPAALQITTGGGFPNGLAGVPYPSQILTATGGVAPYTFSIQGTLPAGFTLSNAQIGGTPSAAGNYGFTVLVTDSAAVANTGSLAVTLVVAPNAPNLVLSGATAAFAVTSGTSTAPSAATIAVTSSVVTQILTFTAVSSVPWLTAGGSTATPGSITVGLNSAALALSSTGSPYTGTVTVTCASQACAGNTQTIAVTLTVTAPPAQLSLGSPLLSYVALSSNPAASAESLSIVNAGGGTLTINSVTGGSSWVEVGAFPATVAPGPGGAVTITANPAGLNAGYYLSSVTVASSAGTATVPVTLLISASSVMTLGPAGTQFSLPQGGALGNSGGSFLVSVSSGNVSYTATVLPGASWLTGGGSGTATPSSPGTVSFAINPAAAAALGVGAYYGTISVTGTGIINAPQAFQVVLSVSAATTTLVPNPEPAGLVFITTAGGSLPPQLIQLFASSTTGIGYQASAAVIDGSGWLSVSPGTGSTSAPSPAQITVTANAAGLSPGVYRGSVGFAFASAAPTVNVTLIVQAPLSGAAAASNPSAVGSGAKPKQTSGPSCAGGQLAPTQTGLVSNFSAPASWPTPLAITLVDTCGNAIGNGEVVATFSNGDPPLILAPVNTATGLYSGTWTPRNTSSQVTILARASVPGYATATTQIAGRVAPNTAPSLNANGTSDIFHPQVGAGLGPGNIVQIYGSGLAGQPGSPAVLPLPTVVNGTSVLIGGMNAPLYYVSPTQINAQIPFELTAGNQYQVIVSANGALTTPQPIQLTQAVPAILQFTSGDVVAQHQDGTLISAASPAVPGEYITIYLSGLGATNPAVASGAASPSNPPAVVVDTPVLTLNTTTIPVSFAGLAPGFVGLYQINFQLPTPLANGNYQLVITQDGVVSNQTVLEVMN